MKKQEQKQLKNNIALKKKLNEKLSEIGQINAAFAIGLVKHFASKYDEQDWKNYQEETGNEKPHFEIPKKHVEQFLNSKLGMSPEIDERNLKFIIWVVEEFMKGVEKSFKEIEKEQEKEIIAALSL